MDAIEGFLFGIFVTLLIIPVFWLGYVTWKDIKERERQELADEIFNRCYNTFELKKKKEE